MDFAMDFFRGFYAFNGLAICLCCIVFWVRRCLWRMRKRRGQRNLGFFPTFTAAGNALQNLQVMAQPRVEHVIAEK